MKEQINKINHSLKALENEDIDFEINCHVSIKCSVIIDFWPITCDWISRTGKRGSGLKSLFEYMETLNPAPKARPDIDACNPKINQE